MKQTSGYYSGRSPEQFPVAELAAGRFLFQSSTNMAHIRATITGIPYARNKTRGNTDAPKEWTNAVIHQTHHLQKITETCLLRITYLLPKSHVPKDFPFGTDLDNLNKRFLDGLNRTVFSEAKGKDSCVVVMETMKVIVDTREEAGAHIEILPIKVG